MDLSEREISVLCVVQNSVLLLLPELMLMIQYQMLKQQKPKINLRTDLYKRRVLKSRKVELEGKE